MEVLRPEALEQVYGLRVRIVPDGEHVMVASEAGQEGVSTGPAEGASTVWPIARS